MAKATKKAVVTAYVLELSEAEASALLGVTWRVGGDVDRTPRKHTDSIGNALLAAGAERTDDRLVSGSIYFAEPE